MKKLAIYIHIPFCKQKCGYCDFNSKPCADKVIQDRYVDALCREICMYSDATKEYEVSSVYFGGGTPSFIESREIARILNILRQNYLISKDAEITLEANPGTIDSQKIYDYKNSGINRISLGVQSMQNEILKKIGRCHSAEDAINGFELTRKGGINNISLDLMFGLPKQTIEDVAETLEKFISMNPEHISAYSLKVEKSTPFGRLQDRGLLKLPSENEEREMYYLIKKKLKDAGYYHYEISNFTKPGFESKHNSAYWERQDYLGFGISAASCFEKVRFSNCAKLEEYIEKISNRESAIDYKEELNEKSISSEKIFLGLRLLKGIPKSYFVTDEWQKEADDLLKLGLLKEERERVGLTDRGLDLANQVFMRFV